MEFEQVYEKYFKDVYRLILGMIRDPNEAEDIAQETFLKALASIGSFDGSKDIRAWLFTIAKNILFSRRRKNRRISDADFDFSTVEDTGVSFAEEFADKESAFRLHRYLHEMDEPYKEVFTLRVFGELDFKSIGRLFQKTDSWARVTFFRAKNMIYKYWKETENE
ncbi:MAG: sigma-70 family RNA polymerase sigma factor [Clostridiales bacterium]|nr:sigma-70 family RNA polymerase sigma factor [Clostridiales bacterium]